MTLVVLRTGIGAHVLLLRAGFLAALGVGLLRGGSVTGGQVRDDWLDLGPGTTLTVGAVVAVLGQCLLLGGRAAVGPPVVRWVTARLATTGSTARRDRCRGPWTSPRHGSRMGAVSTLVTGATGNVGRHVVTGLLGAGAPVRAAVRPSTGPHPGWPAGVERVPFDWQDPATWSGAFEGVRSVLVVRPPQLSRPRTQMLPALEAARDAGVRHVVLISLQGAETNRVVPHAALEAWLRTSGVPWTFVRPSFFMQNLTGTHRAEIRDTDEVVVPAGAGATAFVDTVDVAAVATAALLDPGRHVGQAWTPTGPDALTYDQVAAVLGAELGRPIRYRRPGLLRYARHSRRSGMPWAMVAVTSGIYTVARLGRAAGLTDDVRTVTGRPPVDLRTFVHRERDAWLARPG